MSAASVPASPVSKSVGPRSPKDHALRLRAAALVALEIDYIVSAEFACPQTAAEIDAEIGAKIDASEWEPDAKLRKVRTTISPYLASLFTTRLLPADEERRLFRRMNYAKYRADVLRRKLELANPNITHLERIEFLIGLALRDRNEIVTANTRLVISIVKKFAGVLKTFDELLSEGIETLLRATDKFDYTRGFRFSTESNRR